MIAILKWFFKYFYRNEIKYCITKNKQQISGSQCKLPETKQQMNWLIEGQEISTLSDKEIKHSYILVSLNASDVCVYWSVAILIEPKNSQVS